MLKNLLLLSLLLSAYLSNVHASNSNHTDISVAISEGILAASVPKSVNYNVRDWGYLKYGIGAKDFAEVIEKPTNKIKWPQSVRFNKKYINETKRRLDVEINISARGPRAGIYNTHITTQAGGGKPYIGHYIDKNKTSFTHICKGPYNAPVGGNIGYKVDMPGHKPVYAYYAYSGGSGGIWEWLTVSSNLKFNDDCDITGTVSLADGLKYTGRIAASTGLPHQNDIDSFRKQPKSDRRTAAAEQGDREAQRRLADRYYYGKGLKQDYTQAAKWYTKAAEQGQASAQSELGTFYHNGQGVKQDYTEAAKWYTKAAEQGHALAQYNLGIMYRNGRGVTGDDKEAAKWFTKAAEQGDPNAAKEVEYFRKVAESKRGLAEAKQRLEFSNSESGYGTGRAWLESLSFIWFIISAGLLTLLIAFIFKARRTPSRDKTTDYQNNSTTNEETLTTKTNEELDELKQMNDSTAINSSADSGKQKSSTASTERQKKRSQKAIFIIIASSLAIGAVIAYFRNGDDIADMALYSIISSPLLFLYAYVSSKCNACGAKWSVEPYKKEPISFHQKNKWEGPSNDRKLVFYDVEDYWQYYKCEECSDITKTQKKKETRVY